MHSPDVRNALRWQLPQLREALAKLQDSITALEEVIQQTDPQADPPAAQSQPSPPATAPA